MSKYIPGNQKHLTLENRIYIENELNKGTSFKDIARFLCKDPTTISKEVRAHRLQLLGGHKGYLPIQGRQGGELGKDGTQGVLGLAHGAHDGAHCIR